MRCRCGSHGDAHEGGTRETQCGCITHLLQEGIQLIKGVAGAAHGAAALAAALAAAGRRNGHYGHRSGLLLLLLLRVHGVSPVGATAIVADHRLLPGTGGGAGLTRAGSVLGPRGAVRAHAAASRNARVRATMGAPCITIPVVAVPRATVVTAAITTAKATDASTTTTTTTTARHQAGRAHSTRRWPLGLLLVRRVLLLLLVVLLLLQQLLLVLGLSIGSGIRAHRRAAPGVHVRPVMWAIRTGPRVGVYGHQAHATVNGGAVLLLLLLLLLRVLRVHAVRLLLLCVLRRRNVPTAVLVLRRHLVVLVKLKMWLLLLPLLLLLRVCQLLLLLLLVVVGLVLLLVVVRREVLRGARAQAAMLRAIAGIQHHVCQSRGAAVRAAATVIPPALLLQLHLVRSIQLLLLLLLRCLHLQQLLLLL